MRRRARLRSGRGRLRKQTAAALRHSLPIAGIGSAEVQLWRAVSGLASRFNTRGGEPPVTLRHRVRGNRRKRPFATRPWRDAVRRERPLSRCPAERDNLAHPAHSCRSPHGEPFVSRSRSRRSSDRPHDPAKIVAMGTKRTFAPAAWTRLALAGSAVVSGRMSEPILVSAPCGYGRKVGGLARILQRGMATRRDLQQGPDHADNIKGRHQPVTLSETGELCLRVIQCLGSDQ